MIRDGQAQSSTWTAAFASLPSKLHSMNRPEKARRLRPAHPRTYDQDNSAHGAADDGTKRHAAAG